MSYDRYGFDFNNDGKINFEESHLTYHIERETARNNSGNYSPRRSNISKRISTNKDSNTDNSSSKGNGIIYLILGISALGWILFIVEKLIGR